MANTVNGLQINLIVLQGTSAQSAPVQAGWASDPNSAHASVAQRGAHVIGIMPGCLCRRVHLHWQLLLAAVLCTTLRLLVSTGKLPASSCGVAAAQQQALHSKQNQKPPAHSVWHMLQATAAAAHV